MKKCLQILATPRISSDLEEDFMARENALEKLESVVDIIDNAKGIVFTTSTKRFKLERVEEDIH